MALNVGLVSGQRGPHQWATRASLQRLEEGDAWGAMVRPQQPIDSQQDTKPSEISEFPSRHLFADRRANLSRAFVKIIPIVQHETFLINFWPFLSPLPRFFYDHELHETCRRPTSARSNYTNFFLRPRI